MQKEFKYKIISECNIYGVSVTCKKYEISRTIYYRWLKRYTALGLEGLSDIKKDFVPVNKIDSKIEKTILELIKVYPKYGPKTLNYLLEELGYNISDSAVFNILNRNGLSNKFNRIRFSKNTTTQIQQLIPPITELKSGECWIFWITSIGQIENNQNIYSYTLFDLKSRIACTRLYTEISFKHFEDILTAVALSVATTLNLKMSYICFFDDSKILNQNSNSFKIKISNTLKKQGRNIKVNIIKPEKSLNKIYDLKEEFTKNIISTILQSISVGKTFNDIKIELQIFIRNYNLNNKIQFEDDTCSPIDYHNKMTDNKTILPLWAYIDREY